MSNIMRSIAALIIVALATAIAAAAAAANSGTDTAVTAIRLGVHPGKVRLVIDTTRRLKPSAFALADPYRVVIDLPDVTWRVGAGARSRKAGFVSGYRFGNFAPGRSRIVFDLARAVAIKKNFILPPGKNGRWRIVIDLKEVPSDDFAAHTAKRKPPKSGRAALFVPAPPTKPRRRTRRKVVVVDPGHGGVDPGAIGRGGIYEKNVTLAMARELVAALNATGRYRVLMTRDRDIFVRLRARVAMARAAGADLFVSLHADSLRNRKVSGASVYTLSERASDVEAEGLAARENKADLIAGVDLTGESNEVTNILIDLAQRETMNHSARFARVLVSEMRKTTRFLRKSHRFAGFAVLKAPDVPSVLVEMGYLSNYRDTARLTNNGYQRRLAAAIAESVGRYFDARAKAAER